MEDFEVMMDDKTKLTYLVRELCHDKKFRIGSKYDAYSNKTRKIRLVKYKCSMGPYLESGHTFKSSQCPFHLIYKFNEEEEEFYLDSYDEMHNHLLVEDPRIMPYVKKSYRKPIFMTPVFFKFQTFRAKQVQEFQENVF